MSDSQKTDNVSVPVLRRSAQAEANFLAQQQEEKAIDDLLKADHQLSCGDNTLATRLCVPTWLRQHPWYASTVERVEAVKEQLRCPGLPAPRASRLLSPQPRVAQRRPREEDPLDERTRHLTALADHTMAVMRAQSVRDAPTIQLLTVLTQQNAALVANHTGVSRAILRVLAELGTQ